MLFLKRLTLLIFSLITSLFSADKSNSSKLKSRIGKRLRMLIEIMSPTYIKFGQLLSHRPDVLPKEVCDELLPLTDNTQPESIDIIKQRLADIGVQKEVDIVEIESAALGSASIAQVHKVCVRLPNGETRWEAWKIQKGEIQKVFQNDLSKLRRVIRIIDWFRVLPPLGHLVNEYESWLEEETDFKREYNNLKKASEKNNFKSILQTNIPAQIYAPKPYGVHVADDGKNQLLRMELIQGLNLNSIRTDEQVSTETRKEIVIQALRGFMSQFLLYGFCQADPHISNLIWSDKENKLYFVDWGLAKNFSSIQGLYLLRMFRGFVIGDRNLCYDGLFNLIQLTDNQIQLILPDIDICFDEVLHNLRSESEIKYRKIGTIFLTGILKVILKYKIKINTQSSAIFKAMATTDAVYTTIYPDLSIGEMIPVVIDISQIFLQRLFFGEIKTIQYFINSIDRDGEYSDWILDKLNSKNGKKMIDLLTKPFIPDQNYNLNDPRYIEFFGMISELENIFLLLKNKEY